MIQHMLIMVMRELSDTIHTLTIIQVFIRETYFVICTEYVYVDVDVKDMYKQKCAK